MPVNTLICLSTCPDRETAGRIAEALVEEHLAACVNLVPGLQSVYRWHGAVERADEVLLVAKTTADRFDALCARIVTLHPAELPEVLAVETAAGLPAYLDWVTAQTRPTD